MAGSYRHITRVDGTFCGAYLLDNLGDAHEALEECWEMIQYLTGGDKHKQQRLNGFGSTINGQ